MTKQTTKLNNTDLSVSAAKGILGAIPIAGPVLAEIVNSVVPNQRMDRVIEYLEILDQRMSIMEEERTKAILKDPEKIDLIEESLGLAIKAGKSERRNRIANIVAYGLDSNQIKTEEATYWLKFFGELGDFEILVLIGHSKPNEIYKDVVNGFVFTSPDDILTHISKEKEIKLDILKACRDRLVNLGLLITSFQMSPKGNQPIHNHDGSLRISNYSLSERGKLLLEMMSELPLNDSSSTP